MLGHCVASLAFVLCANAAYIALAQDSTPYRDPRRGPKPDMSCVYFSADPNATDGPAINFFADLYASEESAVTESPGVGRVDFTLDRKTLTFAWNLNYSDLTTLPIGIHVHGPQTPGGEAAILFDMATEGFALPVQGSHLLNEGELAYLVSDRMYVNLHTTKYPAGELRGSIKKARPEC
ncbi:MAG: CHRD domain-containing protein [Rhodospirillaceae bacterium]